MGRVLREDFDDTKWISNIAKALLMCCPIPLDEAILACMPLVPMHVKKRRHTSGASIVKQAIALIRYVEVKEGLVHSSVPGNTLRGLFGRVREAYIHGCDTIDGMVQGFPGAKRKTLAAYLNKLKRTSKEV